MNGLNSTINAIHRSPSFPDFVPLQHLIFPICRISEGPVIGPVFTDTFIKCFTNSSGKLLNFTVEKHLGLSKMLLSYRLKHLLGLNLLTHVMCQTGVFGGFVQLFQPVTTCLKPVAGIKFRISTFFLQKVNGSLYPMVS